MCTDCMCTTAWMGLVRTRGAECCCGESCHRELGNKVPAHNQGLQRKSLHLEQFLRDKEKSTRRGVRGPSNVQANQIPVPQNAARRGHQQQQGAGEVTRWP